MKKTLFLLSLLVSTALVFSGVLTGCSDDEDDVLASDEEITPPDDEGTTPDDEGTTSDEDEGTVDDDTDTDDEEEEPDEGTGNPDPIKILFHYGPSGTGQNGWEFSVHGEDGDFYYTYEDVYNSHSTYGTNLAVMSEMTKDEWESFVTTGDYFGENYGLAFESIDDFWDNYLGMGDEDGYGGVLYYVQPGTERYYVVDDSSESTHSKGSVHNTSGIRWILGEYTGEGEVELPYFYVAIDYYLFGSKADVAPNTVSYEDIPVYDGNGTKLLFVFTINPKDPSVNPQIIFYTYIHITEPEPGLDPLYIPLKLDTTISAEDVEITGEDGDFYMSADEVIACDHTTLGVIATFNQMDLEQWETFVTTGKYFDKTYDNLVMTDVNEDGVVDEDDFFECYLGGSDSERGISFYAYYFDSDDTRHEFASRTTGYRHGTAYCDNGFQWVVCAKDAVFGSRTDHDSIHLGIGVHHQLYDTYGGNNVPVYDEDGQKYLIVLEFQSKNTSLYPDIYLYGYVHMAM